MACIIYTDENGKKQYIDSAVDSFFPLRPSTSQTAQDVVLEEAAETGALADAAATAATSAGTGQLKWIGFDLNFGQVENIVEAVDKALQPVDKYVIQPLIVTLNVLRVFLSNFNSSASIIQAIINQLQSQVTQILDSLVGAGVYTTAIFPAPFTGDNLGIRELAKGDYADGGFPGFISKLRAAAANTADPYRPPFRDEDVVGGLVIMADSDSLADIIKAWRSLSELFNGLRNFDIPAPTNLSSTPGYFDENGDIITSFNAEGEPVKVEPDGTLTEIPYREGIRIVWDDPPGFTPTGYRIYRSQVPGGEWKEEEKKVPDPNNSGEFKKITVRKKYPESDGYWDFAVVPPDSENPADSGKKATRVVSEKRGFHVDDDALEEGKTYYYVVRATIGIGSAAALSNTSVETSSTLVTCVNPDAAVIVPHGGGEYEYLSTGVNGISRWYSVTLGNIPLLRNAVVKLNDGIEILKGWVNTSTTSMTEYIEGLSRKIQNILDIYAQVTAILELLNSFSFPSVNYLVVPEEKGGMKNFISRVQTAQHPDYKNWDSSSGTPEPSFSGKDGYNAAIVFVYGADPLTAAAIEFLAKFLGG